MVKNPFPDVPDYQPNAVPKRSNVTVNKFRALTTEKDNGLGLYQLELDLLRVGLPDTGKDRPKDMSGEKGSNCLLITLKRDKP